MNKIKFNNPTCGKYKPQAWYIYMIGFVFGIVKSQWFSRLHRGNTDTDGERVLRRRSSRAIPCRSGAKCHCGTLGRITLVARSLTRSTTVCRQSCERVRCTSCTKTCWERLVWELYLSKENNLAGEERESAIFVNAYSGIANLRIIFL